MARATLEMFLKLTGADKTSRELNKVSKSTKQLDIDVKNSAKQNAEFAAGMSGAGKLAIAGAAAIAGKSLFDFSINAIKAASSAQEAAGAFGTTFGNAAEQLNLQLAENANLFGLTSAEAQQLISVFGSVAQGIGFTQQESADLSSELFNLAGDIASFNNITAGAAPVLQAFRSALVGEREALKTYGIAITEAEVQTKAFAQTGKTSADELTRQEKALATTALIFERSAVQQGNAAREAAGFAAQTLIARSATQELSEQLGEELLPAAGEVLKIFNEMRVEATPELIDRFSDLNLTLLGTVGLFQDFRDAVSFGNDEQSRFGELVQRSINPINLLGKLLKARGILERGQIEIDKAAIKQQDERIKKFESYRSQIDNISQSFIKNRQQVLINTTQTAKFGETIDKKLNPIFGEQNSLILTNIQLETNRNTLMKLINNANQDLAQAQSAYNSALKEVNRLTIEENVNDAEAAIKKAELETKIGLLTKAQSDGKDVSLDLALAQAELAKAEFELANDSDTLKSARNLLTVAEQQLEKATESQKKAIKKRNDELVRSIDLTNQQTNANRTLASTITGLEGTDFGRLVSQGFVSLGTTPAEGVTTPADTIGNQSGVSQGGAGAGTTTITNEIYIGDEKIEEVVQKVNTRIQNQGKTFAVR
jgi:hypothetical protein